MRFFGKGAMRMNMPSEMKMVKIDELVPYARNARTHSEEQIRQIQASIREFGFVNPVIIDDDYNIIAGHGRVAAARAEGMQEVPCVFVGHLTETQKRAYILADNKLALNAGWDPELLKIEIDELRSLDFDIELTGFELEEIENIFESEEPEDSTEDEYEVNVPEEPKTKLGDIYQLGRHRLMCGDSTDKATVEKLMNGVKADMVFTDPPYGMCAVSKSGVLSKTYKTDIMNDDTNDVAINSYILVNELFNNVKQVWWGANYYTECLPSAECWIVWDKNNGGSDQTDCELAWTNFRSVVRQFTMASEKINRVHPTQKPVKLIADIFYKFDKDKSFNNVLDLFGGSGSTLIACEQLNRTCYMMELDPKYCDVIIDRWETFTGENAVLLKT
jgi:16S rRNA G966 N2-methylase RsmD